MPIGCASLVPWIADELIRRRPALVLDLGIGMGFYGAVVRQYGDMGVQPWRTHLIGVEGFAGYRNPCWDLYDQAYVSEIGMFLATTLETCDAILLLDVLEHFDRDAGLQVLAAARGRLTPTGRLYVGTPAVWMEQGAAHGNEYERHRSLWTAEELMSLGFTVHWDGTADQCGNQMLAAYWEAET